MRTLEQLGISPVPWYVRDCIDEDGNVCGKWLVDSNGNDLITELDGDGVDGIAANAHIIKASPLLYDVCNTALYYLTNYCVKSDERDEVVKALHSALARASGESEETK